MGCGASMALFLALAGGGLGGLWRVGLGPAGLCYLLSFAGTQSTNGPRSVSVSGDLMASYMDAALVYGNRHGRSLAGWGSERSQGFDTSHRLFAPG